MSYRIWSYRNLVEPLVCVTGMDAPDETLRHTLYQSHWQLQSYRTTRVGPFLLIWSLIVCSLVGCAPRRWDWWRRPESEPARATAPATPQQQQPSSPSDQYTRTGWQAPPTTAPNQPPAVDYPEANRSSTYLVSDETPSPEEALDPTLIVARVGDEVILAGDVLGPINQALAQYKGQIPEEEMNRQRVVLLQQQLPQVVETKMLYVAYLRWLQQQSQGKGDIHAAMPKIWERVFQKFDEEELPKLYERYKVETPAQLDAKLREYGWSIAKQRRFYGERNLGMAAAFEKVREVPETTHEEMLAYYEEHKADYEFASKAKWEQLTARFDRFPDQQAARQAIEQMGNEVALGGSPFWAVAKRSSQDIHAQEGGVYDWTNQGSLASDALDQAIFSFPVGELSPIIEDDVGYHIVRVLERRDAGRTPFTEAQGDIKKNLEEEKRKAAFQEYMKELRRAIPVWTIYDRPAGEVAGRPQ